MKAFHTKLTYKGVSAVSFHNKLLYVGYVNGIVQVIDTTYKKDAFEIALKVASVSKVMKLVEENVFLKTDLRFNDFISNEY